MRRAAALLVALTTAIGCRSSESSALLTSTVDSAGVRITTVQASPSALVEWALDTISRLTVTGAGTGDSAAFSHVGSARWLNDGRIVVADAGAERLLLFDSTGTLARTLGRAGDGPGEFRNLASVSVLPGNTLLTFDGSLRRLTTWQPDSGYRGSIRVGGTSPESWPTDAWLWQDGKRVVVLQLSVTSRDSIPPAAGVRRWPMRARLTLQDSVGTLLASSRTFAGMYTGIYEGGDTRLPFSNQPFAAASRDRVYFGSGSTFELSYLNSDFAEAGEVRWPQQREDLTREEVEAVKAEAMALAAGRLPPDQLAKRFEMNFAAQILPKERPAIGRVFVDDQDRVWVERFEATRLGSRIQKAGDRWIVLSRDGAPLARLILPNSTRLEDVHGMQALVVISDSLDVPMIAVREIVRK